MRKLILLAVMAAAAMAFTAPSAFAAVEVEDSATGVMCDFTTSGECDTEFESSDSLELAVHTFFGTIIYRCDVHVPIDLHTNGTFQSNGPITVTNEGGTQNCDDLTPCELPWTGELHEAPGREALSYVGCLSALTTCEGTLHSLLSDTGTGYTGEMVDVEFEGDSACEMSDHFLIDGIRIHHP